MRETDNGDEIRSKGLLKGEICSICWVLMHVFFPGNLDTNKDEDEAQLHLKITTVLGTSDIFSVVLPSEMRSILWVIKKL